LSRSPQGRSGASGLRILEGSLPDPHSVGQLRKTRYIEREQRLTPPDPSALLLFIGCDIAELIQDNLENSSDFDYEGTTSDQQEDNLLSNINVRLYYAAIFVVCIADLLAQACVVELGLGFLYCLHANYTALHNILRLSVLVVSFILFALAVSSLGLVNAEYTKYFNYLNSQVWIFDPSTFASTPSSSTPFDQDAFYRGVKAAHDLSIAFDVIIFVASVLLVGFSVYVLYTCRRNPALKSVSKL
jgi:hypothetical protein